MKKYNKKQFKGEQSVPESKIKISKKELDEIYDIEDDTVDKEVKEIEKEDKNATFEEYTEQYDKKDLEE